MKKILSCCVALLLIVSLAFAQNPFEMKLVTVTGQLMPKTIAPGEVADIMVTAKIEAGFHINSHQPGADYLIPTVLTFEPLSNASFSEIIYPEPKMATFAFSEEALSVYENEIILKSKVTLSRQFPAGAAVIRGKFSYQACNDQNCFAPTTEAFEIPFQVTATAKVATPTAPISNDALTVPPEKSSTEPRPEDQSVGIAPSSQPETNQVEPAAAVQFTSDELKAKQVIEKGLPYAILAFFLFGLALNLTPCVYPVIPITVGYFGGQSGRQKGAAFIMALFYVIGIAIIFAVLGLISGLAGKQWGFLFQNPWFVIVITTIILAMAASMFGAFEITVPSWLMTSLGKTREGTVGALIMGLTVGVVIAPCAAGIIIGLVGLVAKLGIVAKGTLLFFVMGLGLGLPYLFLATFSGLLNKLPRSGMWMVWVRKLFGILLIGVALYFFLPQAKHIADQQGFFFGLLAIFGGLLLGFLDHAPGYTRGFKIGRGVFGVAMMVLGIIWVNQAIHAKTSALDWLHYENQSLTELTAGNQPVFIDFYADWCAPCKEMDRTTFQDKRIIELSKQLKLVKVDCTAPNEAVRNFMQQFEVTGMPTLVFIDKNGLEQRDLREIGYIDAEKLLDKLKRLLE
ncbi:MAG: thioredoxin domain-containing protein [candidate division KSB1 bacterium]|nr:thioredoxin domain-containing protein [candidate division KSB1 bacterium]